MTSYCRHKTRSRTYSHAPSAWLLIFRITLVSHTIHALQNSFLQVAGRRGCSINRCRRSAGTFRASPGVELPEPNQNESRRFGRRDYWNERYTKEDGFSWYAGWTDLEPFFRELVPVTGSRVLIPGIGNDASMVDMYDVGYTNMVAFDYAEQGVECARRLFGPNRLKDASDDNNIGVELAVADARHLPYLDDEFDAVLEKGTLDAVYLSGGKDKEQAARYLNMAVSELGRVIRRGGVLFSVSAACTSSIERCFQKEEEMGVWKKIRDGSLYITEEGYASINVDGTMLVWERL